MLWHRLLFEFLFECDFSFDHTNISKKSFRNTSLTGKSHQLNTWTLQGFPCWETSLIWSNLFQSFTCISTTQQMGLVRREWVRCWWESGRGGSPAQATHPGGVLHQHPELPGKTGSKETVWPKSGDSKEAVAEEEEEEEEVQQEWEGSQSSTCNVERQAIKGKVGWTQMSEAERHVWKDQSILPRKRQGAAEIVQDLSGLGGFIFWSRNFAELSWSKKYLVSW